MEFLQYTNTKVGFLQFSLHEKCCFFSLIILFCCILSIYYGPEITVHPNKTIRVYTMTEALAQQFIRSDDGD